MLGLWGENVTLPTARWLPGWPDLSRHNGTVRLDPDDELSELIPLDQAATIAQVSDRTLRRWIAAGRLRLLAGHVIERQLLDVEAERRAARRAGRPGARLPRLAG